jgi:hypothetical protein
MTSFLNDVVLLLSVALIGIIIGLILFKYSKRLWPTISYTINFYFIGVGIFFAFKTLLALLATLQLAVAAPPLVKLAWDDPGEAENAIIAGYKIFLGPESGVYSRTVPIAGIDTKATVEDLVVGETYFSVVKAIGKNGLESGPSNEITFTISPTPGAPSGLRVDVTVTVTVTSP